MVGSFFIKLEHGVSVFIAEPRIFAKNEQKRTKKRLKRKGKSVKKMKKIPAFYKIIL